MYDRLYTGTVDEYRSLSYLVVSASQYSSVELHLSMRASDNLPVT